MGRFMCSNSIWAGVFQVSNICYPKRVEIEYDLKDLESNLMEYTIC